MKTLKLALALMLLLTIAKYETPSGRLIQRDYSDGNLYNYYNKSGADGEPTTFKGAEKMTDSGRKVYGGGGISPDEFIKPQTITNAKATQQAKLLDSLFSFLSHSASHNRCPQGGR